MNQLFNFSILSLVLIFFLGCDKEKEPIPSYLHIKKFTLTTNNLSQGTNTQDITDAKVFANGKEVGTFELPVTIPIFSEGVVEITIFPTIKETGSAYNRKYYKPYISFIDTINLKALRVDTIQPTTKYKDNAKFDWILDFENTGSSLVKYGLNNTTDSLKVIPTSSPGINQPFSNSNYCGVISIDSPSIFEDFEVATIASYTVPSLGTDVYVEMDFKSNANFQVGIFTDDGASIVRSPVFYAFPTNNVWKKIYVNLKTETGDLRPGSNIRVFFGVYKDPANPDLKPLVYMDNLKLVYVP
ncbi:MAG: hypothetical protein PSX81_02965 [bacterium]|nr:hypothetical protein [bacterium]